MGITTTIEADMPTIIIRRKYRIDQSDLERLIRHELGIAESIAAATIEWCHDDDDDRVYVVVTEDRPGE